MGRLDAINIVILILILLIFLIAIVGIFLFLERLNQVGNTITQINDILNTDVNANVCRRANEYNYPTNIALTDSYSYENAAVMLAMCMNSTVATCTSSKMYLPPGFTAEPITIVDTEKTQNIKTDIGHWVESNDAVICVFSSSYFNENIDFSSLANYIKLKQVPPTLLSNYVNGMLVNAEVYAVYLLVKAVLFRLLLKPLLRKKFYITGHGIGSIFAQMAAFDYADKLSGGCYVSSSLALGNQIWSDQFIRLSTRTYRILNSCDISALVPPPTLFGNLQYVQTGSQVIVFNLNLGSAFQNNWDAYIQYFKLTMK